MKKLKNKQEVGRILKESREGKGLTVSALSEALDIDPQAIRQAEAGFRIDLFDITRLTIRLAPHLRLCDLLDYTG